MGTPRHKVIHNLICIGALLCLYYKNERIFKYICMKCVKKQRCRDGVMNDFVSWCRNLLVSFLFHDVTSLHPPSFPLVPLILLCFGAKPHEILEVILSIAQRIANGSMSSHGQHPQPTAHSWSIQKMASFSVCLVKAHGLL